MPMSELNPAPVVARLEADLDHFPCAAFLVDVAPNGFPYRKVNRAYRDLHRGLDAQVPVGLRRAAMRDEHFRKCCDSGAPIEFREGDGDSIRRLQLEPVVDQNANVVALIGVVTVLGALPHPGAGQIEQALLHERQMLENHAAQLAHIRGVLERGADVGQACALLAAAQDGLATQQEELSRRYFAEEEPAEIDLAPLCASVGEVMDPMGDWRLTYDDAELRAEPALFQQALRGLLGMAMTWGQDWLTVDLGPGRDGFIKLIVTTSGGADPDGAQPGLEAAPSVAPRLSQRLAQQDGRLEIAPDPSTDELAFQAELPGQILWQDRGWGALDQVS